MDALSSALGLSLIGNRQPTTPEQWNARYEAMSFERDWWFISGAAAVRWIRSVILTTAKPRLTVALRRARA